MQLRVVSDQPWDVAADVLAVPFAGEPNFKTALGEIDRRSGGELHAVTEFGELKAERSAAAVQYWLELRTSLGRSNGMTCSSHLASMRSAASCSRAPMRQAMPLNA